MGTHCKKVELFHLPVCSVVPASDRHALSIRHLKRPLAYVKYNCFPWCEVNVYLIGIYVTNSLFQK